MVLFKELRASVVKTFYNAHDENSNAPSAKRLWINLLISTVFSVLHRSSGFALWSQAMRFQLGYTTLGTQYLNEFIFIGNAFGVLVGGIVYRAKGWRACVVLELIFGAVGSGVLWLGVAGYMPLPVELAWVAQTVSTSSFYMVEMILHYINLSNFPTQYSGRVASLIAGCNSLNDGVVYSNLWPLFVSDPADYSAGSQKLASWFLMLTIWDFLMPLLILLLLRQWGKKPPKVEVEMTEISKGGTATTYTTSRYSSVSIKLTRIIVSREFLALSTMFLTWGGAKTQLEGDWGRMSQSLGLDDLVPQLVRVASFGGFFGKIFMGVLLDRYKHKIPSWIYFEFTAGLMFICTMFLSFSTRFMLSSLLAPILFSLSVGVFPVLFASLSDKYGPPTMGVLYGILQLWSVGVNFAIGGFSSVLYDDAYSAQPANAGGICYGAVCYRSDYAILTGLSGFGMVVLAIFGRERAKKLSDESLI